MELGLRGEGYSPSVLRKIEYAGCNATSFAQASEGLGRLAELSISAKHVQRLTEKPGRERQQQRDAEVASFREGELEPEYKEAPRVVAIHVGAGKVQLRKDDGAKGVREPHWGDTKVACLVNYEDKTYSEDPQPDPPSVFLDPPRAVQLYAELGRVRNRPETLIAPAAPTGLPAVEEDASKDSERSSPTPLMKTAVASMAKVDEFGWLVAAEAQKRNFYEAARKVIIGDGGNWIEPLGQFHFPGWIQILDAVHLFSHLYTVAQCCWPGAARRAWNFYEVLLRLAWAGEVDKLIARMAARFEQMTARNGRDVRSDDIETVKRTIEFIRANRDRLDYPRFRREGLPITSTLVESLIKQFNQRIKGTEKFWINGGVEAVLQVRAAYLSQDDRADRHYDGRPLGRIAGRPPARASA